MPSSPSPTEVLRRNHEAAQRLVAGVSKARTLELLKTAQLGLERRLRTAEGLGGPGKGSFTAVQLRATLAQVRAVLAPLQIGMRGVVLEQGKEAAAQAATGAERYLRSAEQRFKGLGSQRLALDQAKLVDRVVAGTESSVLSRLLGGSHEGKRAGILQRYGHNVVGHFEDILQQRLIQKTPWEEVKSQLIEKSEFLQGAPAHWAERIVRTEVANQAGRASQESIVEADQTLGDMCKILSAVFDARTGADSYAVHGQIRRPSESFDSWFGSFMHPPDRPNDRGIVVPHRISWPIPPELKPKGAGAVSSRWAAEGRKGGPPSMPLQTTIPLDLFGKQTPPPVQGENPGSQVEPPKELAPPVDRRVSAQVPGTLRGRWPEEPSELAAPAAPEPVNYIAKQIGGQGGSNPGGIFEGSDGVQRYVKFYKNDAQAAGEHLANSLYSDLGLGGVKSTTFEHEGNLTYASEMLPDAKPLGSVLTPKLAKKALDGFAADVLMANWDAAGMSLDNMLVGKDGKITRIDNGAAFLTRAKGTLKPEHLLESPTEWESFFNPSKNPAYARLAKAAGVTGPQDLAASIKKGVKSIVQVRDDAGGWAKYVEARSEGLTARDRQKVIDMLEARTDFLVKQAAVVKAPQKSSAKKASTAKPEPLKPITRPADLKPITPREFGETKERFIQKVGPTADWLKTHPGLPELKGYTATEYRSMNKLLVKGELGSDFSKTTLADVRKRVDKTQQILLDAAKAGHALEGVVLRGISVDNSVLDHLMTTEQSIAFDAFTSTTVNPSVADSFSKMNNRGHRVIFRIRQHSAIPIDKVSVNDGEGEALLPHGTRFHIISRQPATDNSGANYIDIEQI